MEISPIYPIYVGFVYHYPKEEWRMAAVTLDGVKKVYVDKFVGVPPTQMRRHAREAALRLARELAVNTVPLGCIAVIRINARPPKDQPPMSAWEQYAFQQKVYQTQILRTVNIALEFARHKVNQHKVRQLYVLLKSQETGIWKIPLDDPLEDCTQ